MAYYKCSQVVYRNINENPDAVKFIDFEGIQQTYSVTEFLNLTELPTPQTKNGLTFESWGWSLSGAKAYVQEYGGLVIGANYKTSDNKLHLYLSIPRGLLTLKFGLASNGDMTWEWGDGSDNDVVTGTDLITPKYITHTFPRAGNYIVKVEVPSNKQMCLYGGNTSELISFATVSTYVPSATYGAMSCLQSIECPENLRICGAALFGAEGLTSISFSQENIYLAWNSLGPNADNRSLKYYVFPNTETTAQIIHLSDCVNCEYIAIPENLIYFSPECFAACKSLKELYLPPHSDIASFFCADCVNLTKVGYSSNYYLTMPSSSFEGCSALESIGLNLDELTQVGNDAFKNCRRFSLEYFPENLTTIGDEAFSGCGELKGLFNLPTTLTTIGARAFDGCFGLDMIIIPSSVTAIGDNAFRGCTTLKVIDDQSIRTTIQNGCYEDCYGLKTVIIPSTVTTIGKSAFANCYSLPRIVIPESVTSIGDSAFSCCYGLREIVFTSTTPPTVESSTTFQDLPSDCIIKVPQGTLASYILANNYPSSMSYTYEEY